MLLISYNTLSFLQYDDCTFNFLFKKAGYKLIGTFQQQITVELNDDWKLLFFSKCKGKNLKKSVYDLPSILASFIIYGNCIILQQKNDTIGNIDEIAWDHITHYLNNTDNKSSIKIHKCTLVIPPIVSKSSKEIVRKVNKVTDNNSTKITNMDVDSDNDFQSNSNNCNYNYNYNTSQNDDCKTYLDCRMELTEDDYIEYDCNHN
jgi:hypothetical protein